METHDIMERTEVMDTLDIPGTPDETDEPDLPDETDTATPVTKGNDIPMFDMTVNAGSRSLGDCCE